MSLCDVELDVLVVRGAEFSRVVSDVEGVVGKPDEGEVEDAVSGVDGVNEASAMDPVVAVMSVAVVDAMVVNVDEEEEPEGTGDGC